MEGEREKDKMREGMRVVLKVVRYSAGGCSEICKTERNVQKGKSERKRETGEREGCAVSTRKT